MAEEQRKGKEKRETFQTKSVNWRSDIARSTRRGDRERERERAFFRSNYRREGEEGRKKSPVIEAAERSLEVFSTSGQLEYIAESWSVVERHKEQLSDKPRSGFG